MAADENALADADAPQAPSRRRRADASRSGRRRRSGTGRGRAGSGGGRDVGARQAATSGLRSRAERQRALRRQERSRRVSMVLGGLLGVAVVVLGVVVVGPRVVDTVGGWFGSDDGTTAAAAAADGSTDPVLAGDRRTVLVATFDEGAGDTVTDIQLLTVAPGERVEAIVLVPASTITDVPGYGLITLADAGGLGGLALLELSLENGLDIAVDTAVGMTQSSWAALLARSGGFEVAVREPVDVADDAGEVTRRFEAGPQFLDGPRLAELLTVDAVDEAELAALPRAQQVYEGFLDAIAGDLDALFEDGAPMLETSDPAVVEEVVRALAAARADGRLDVVTLPVEPLGDRDEVVYQVEDRGLALAADLLGAGAAEETVDADGVRLEVLNGNGTVGVGADVAELLVPLGHQVVITGNADSFDQETTLVTVREDDEELLAAAREIVETLGVGQVTLSSIPSTTVDITIVVGADWDAR